MRNVSCLHLPWETCVTEDYPSPNKPAHLAPVDDAVSSPLLIRRLKIERLSDPHVHVISDALGGPGAAEYLVCTITFVHCILKVEAVRYWAAVQYRPKKFDKLILHQDIGANLSKLVSMHAIIYSAAPGPLLAVSLHSLASPQSVPCRLPLETVHTLFSMDRLELARRH